MKSHSSKHIRFPGWAFLCALAVYLELLLHIWTAETLVLGRLGAILLFGLGAGAALGFLVSLLKPTAEKWTAAVLGLALGVLMLIEYFLNDSFGTYMTVKSIFTGAEGVATGYFETVMNLLAKSWWRIGLVLLPVAAYVLVAQPRKRSPKRLAALALAAALSFGGGFGLVHLTKLDTALLSTAANFDGSVRAFGLNMTLVLDLTGKFSGGGNVQFEIPEIPETTQPQTTPPETQPGTEPQETTEPTEPPVVYMPHAYDLDFAALAEESRSQEIASVHRYVASLTPAMENEMTGLFAGKNLILITAEAFCAEAIDPELTPTLYRLATQGIHFTDYYHPVWGAGTTGGEFANLVGAIPYNGVDTMMEAKEQNLFFTMGNQLQKLGYTSAAFHNNDHTFYNRHQTHTYLGYDTFFAYGNGMEELISNVWTRSDLEMVDVTLPEYLDQQPFSLYYMTVSGHSSYNSYNAMAQKNYHLVEDLQLSTTVKYYLATQIELDRALESMVRMLEEAGIADDTVIVLSTDHYPYGLASSDTWGNGVDFLAELYGVPYVTETTRDHSALILWSGCLEDMDITVTDPVYALDILPTLSNLFGLEYDSRLMIGRDVFSDEEPLVIWPLSGSWKTDKGYYNAKQGLFTPAEGVEVEEGYVERIQSIVRNKITFCKSIQWYNYYNVISDLMGFERKQ